LDENNEKREIKECGRGKDVDTMDWDER
jgi:hypothetical protein